jgi:hypothetical protein
MEGFITIKVTEFTTNKMDKTEIKNRSIWKYSFILKETFPMFSSVASLKLNACTFEGKKQQGQVYF